jgi:hypothetical protein
MLSEASSATELTASGLVGVIVLWLLAASL